MLYLFSGQSGADPVVSRPGFGAQAPPTTAHVMKPLLNFLVIGKGEQEEKVVLEDEGKKRKSEESEPFILIS